MQENNNPQDKSQEEILNNLDLEHQIMRKQMLNQGLAFWVPKRSLLKYLPGGEVDKLGRKVRTFTFYKPYLNTMDLMSDIKLEIVINLARLQEGDTVRYKNEVIRKNAKLMGKLIAYGVLNNAWKIKLFGGLFGRYFAGRLDSEKLHDLCKLIEELEDAGNFINSTVLVAGMQRTTEPIAEQIEKTPTAAKQSV